MMSRGHNDDWPQTHALGSRRLAPRMRLAFVISSLRRGGAEGVLARLANGMAARGHDITLITLGATPSEYPLNATIRWVPLDVASPSAGCIQGLANNLRRLRVLRQTLRTIAPAAALSFMDTTNVLTLLAAGRRLPVVVSERIHPAQHDTGRLWRWLRTKTYPLAHSVVVQTQAAKNFFPPPLRPRIRVIPNAVPAIAQPHEAEAPGGGKRLVAMGRLEWQKGFDMLLRAFAALQGHEEWTLVIYGEGKERAALESLRAELGLDQRVSLPGRVDDTQAALRGGDIFVLPSRFEGFPNVLTEAMACGLPVIAADCESGPADIIRPGEDGLLVPPGDISALAQALGLLMSDRELRNRLGESARSVVQRFREDNILNMWEDVLETAVRDLSRQG